MQINGEAEKKAKNENNNNNNKKKNNINSRKKTYIDISKCYAIVKREIM